MQDTEAITALEALKGQVEAQEAALVQAYSEFTGTVEEAELVLAGVTARLAEMDQNVAYALNYFKEASNGGA